MKRTPRQTLALLRAMVATINRLAEAAEPMAKQCDRLSATAAELQPARRSLRSTGAAGRAECFQFKSVRPLREGA